MEAEEFCIIEEMDIDEDDDDDFKKELEEINKERELKKQKDQKKVFKEKTEVNIVKSDHKNPRRVEKCETPKDYKTEHRKRISEIYEYDEDQTTSYPRNREYETTDFKRLFKPLEVDKTMDKMVVGKEIAYRLAEPKMHLIQHTVRVLGVDMSKEIFEETKSIAKQGGLKTDTGTRKRTMGGVFLYLLRARYASKEQCKEIFKEEERIKKKFKQKTRKRLSKETKEEMKKLTDSKKS